MDENKPGPSHITNAAENETENEKTDSPYPEKRVFQNINDNARSSFQVIPGFYPLATKDEWVNS